MSIIIRATRLSLTSPLKGTENEEKMNRNFLLRVCLWVMTLPELRKQWAEARREAASSRRALAPRRPDSRVHTSLTQFAPRQQKKQEQQEQQEQAARQPGRRQAGSTQARISGDAENGAVHVPSLFLHHRAIIQPVSRHCAAWQIVPLVLQLAKYSSSTCHLNFILIIQSSLLYLLYLLFIILSYRYC